jgi:Mg2+-importing ATPase
VDVAKEAATIVLLDKDLNVLAAGVREGRMTIANTLKYILHDYQRQLWQHV